MWLVTGSASELLLWKTIKCNLILRQVRLSFVQTGSLLRARPDTKQRLLQGFVIYVTGSKLGSKLVRNLSKQNL